MILLLLLLLLIGLPAFFIFKSRTNSLTTYYASLKATILASPVEIFLSVFFFILSIPVASDYDGNESLALLLSYFFICLSVSYSTNILFKGKKRIFYYLSSLLLPLTISLFIFRYDHEISFLPFFITSVCSLFLIYTSRRLTNNSSFTFNALNVTANYIISFLICFLILGILVSIIYSLKFILDIDIDDDFLFNLLLKTGFFFLFILLPILFLTLEHQSQSSLLSEPSDSDTSPLNNITFVILNYILTPTVLIYGVILYLYFGKIAFTWTLPKGIISTVSIIFIIGGVLLSIFSTLSKKRFLSWVYDYFAIISFPAFIMLWISVLRRISDYGLTGNRVCLLLTVIILSVWVVMSLFKKYNKYQYLTIFTIVVYMLFTYVPGIRYSDFDRRSRDVEQVLVEDIIIRELYIYEFTEIYTPINIEVYKNWYPDNIETTIVNDSLVIKDEHSNKEIFKESCHTILSSMCEEVGLDVDYYKTADLSILDDKFSWRVSEIYYTDNARLSISHIKLERIDGKNFITGASIANILTK